MSTLQATIESAFENRAEITHKTVTSEIRDAVEQTITDIDSGKLRVAEKQGNDWVVHQWVKKAVLLSFRIADNEVIRDGYTNYFDKVDSKFADYRDRDFRAGGFRVVPPAAVRKGSYIAKNVVVMPSYVNIGAYVDEGTMVDTWATVGSCAQIGKNVHLSGGVGIGGVLEPLQANPTIIEDNCFIGARSEIVEGVIVGEGSVVSMGVYIGQSTKIFNRETGEVSYGRIPPGSVVVSGNLPSADGSYSLYCAVIVKRVDEQTRSKTSINDLAADFGADLVVLDLSSTPAIAQRATRAGTIWEAVFPTIMMGDDRVRIDRSVVGGPDPHPGALARLFSRGVEFSYLTLIFAELLYFAKLGKTVAQWKTRASTTTGWYVLLGLNLVEDF